jgi:hypothetical protein
MPLQCPTRPLSVLASALAVAGTVLAAAGCSHLAPLGPVSVSLPPPRQLESPIIMQVMRSESPTPTGKCPAGSIDLYGLALVPRASVSTVRPPHLVGGKSTASPAATPTPSSAPPVGVACYLPAGQPVTVMTAAVSSVATYAHPQGPDSYGFVVAFPAADVAALTAVATHAYEAGDAVGMSVAGKLWQAPQIQSKPNSLRGAQITLLSKSQARQLHRLLVPSS